MPWLPTPVLINRASAQAGGDPAASPDDLSGAHASAALGAAGPPFGAARPATGREPFQPRDGIPMPAAAGPASASRAGQALMWLVVVALLGGGVLVLFRDRLLTTESGYPATWDARAQPLARFVEQARGLTFKHPIEIDFLSEAEFVALFTGPAPDEQAFRSAAALGKVLDAKGAAVGYNPLDGQATLSATSTLGFYSPTADRIVVRGDALTPGVRLTLAHELTHALQAQHFEITLTDANDLELRSVLEADAMRIEDQYYATMTPADQAVATTDNTMTPEQAAVLATLPSLVVQVQYAPYRLGPRLLETVLAQQGNAGVDQLVHTPPSESVLIDRALFGTGATTESLINVAPPAGATVIEPLRLFSAFEMLVMLDTWLPWEMARNATDGWGASGYVSYERADGLTCFSAAVATSAGPHMVAALTWWAKASHSAAVPMETAGQVTFEACERGAAAGPTPTQPISTLDALEIEEYLATPDPSLPCVARKIMSDPVIESQLLVAQVPPEQLPTFVAVQNAASTACSAAPPVG